ncbi:MAG: hypothetical protein J1E98_11575 [Lachnospiraceae bacterium]|nr:hypothetical protein [Lachnospiraceae bacterium]
MARDIALNFRGAARDMALNMVRDDSSRGMFQCEFGRGFLKKISGNEKALYLEITQNGIKGKAIVYQENTKNTYTGDVDYEIGAVTKYERMMFQGLVTFVIHVHTNTLYGREKYQLRFPGMQDIEKASTMLRNLLAANQDGNSGLKPVNAQTPTARVVAPYQSEPVQVSDVVTPTVKEPVQAQVQAPKVAETVQVKPVEAVQDRPVEAVQDKPVEAVQDKPVAKSLEELKKKYEKLEAVYQTGMVSEKEYKLAKAEYISCESGLDEFYNKLKINIEYSEMGFLSEKEFDDFKNEVIDDASNVANVPTDTYKQNLKKLLLLNLCEILANDEYSKICNDIVGTVQYVSDDSEDRVVQKIDRWPVLKECEILSPAQYDQFLKIVAEDTKIKMGESIPILEHKLMRLSTLSKTFIFTPEEFEKKKQEFIADMSEIDYSSDAKLAAQIERLMALKRCEWMEESEYQAKKDEVLKTIEGNSDAVQKMQLFKVLAEVTYITKADYDNFKNGVIDDIFSNYSEIGELKARAQTLMNLKEASIVTETEFDELKKKLLAL